MPAGLAELVERAWSNRGFGDFWQHCLVAEGALDVATDAGTSQLWDYAAVQLLVEEAGGRCIDLRRRRARTRTARFVSTNGALHDEVVALLGAANP